MRLRNTTDYPDRYLRRMIGWVCREVEFPVREVREANVCNSTRYAFSGRAWPSYDVLVRVGADDKFPLKPFVRFGVTLEMRDRTEALVAICAHEIWHLRQYRMDWRERSWEHDAYAEGMRVLRTFREKRETLEERWYAGDEGRSGSVQAKRANLARKRYAECARKAAKLRRELKSVAARANRYKKQVRYYENRGSLQEEADFP